MDHSMDEHTRRHADILPLVMFENTVTALQSRSNDGMAQLAMWNVLIRHFNTIPQHQAVFICGGVKLPHQAFQEYMCNISVSGPRAHYVSQELRSSVEENLFIKELSSLEMIETYLRELDDDIISKGKKSVKLSIVVQDLGALLNFESSISLAKSYALASQIFVRLRKLAKLYGCSIILYENVPSGSRMMEQFKEQFLDYKVTLRNDGSNAEYKVEDFGHNFLGFEDPVTAAELLKGKSMQINSLFNIS